MLGIQGMNTHRVAHLREAIGQGPDRRDFRRLNTGMQQSTDAGITPTCCHLIQILIEIPEDDVAVTVNQRRGRQGS